MARLILMFTILLQAACATTSSPGSTVIVDCGDEAFASTPECQKQPQQLWFRDELEPDQASGGGDRPAIAGCHVSYTDSACTQGRDVYAADICETRTGQPTKLMEWTDGTCHASSTTRLDRKPYDCNAWCVQQGHAAGECKTTADGVCGNKASAYCKCTGATMPGK